MSTQTDIELRTSDPKQVALTIVAQAHAIVIRDQTSLTLANNQLIFIKKMAREIDAEFEPQIKGAYAVHKSLVAQKKKWMNKIKDAEDILTPKIVAYMTEADARRFEAQRAAQLAAEKVERIAEETADQASAFIAQGRFAESQKLVEEAAAKIEEARAAMPIIPEKAKAEGTSLRETWDFEITDAALIPREYLMPDIKKIGGIIKETKWQTAIPGVRAYPVRRVATRIEP